MNANKGFIIPVLFISLGLLILGLVGLAAYKMYSKLGTVGGIPLANTSEWKTYRNEKYGFELKYSSNYSYQDDYTVADYKDSLTKKNLAHLQIYKVARFG